MRKKLCVGLMFASSVAVHAADKLQLLDVKLGLWEVSSTITPSGQMPLPAEVLARLTPEQRARIEERTKSRSSEPAKTTTRKHCLTREQFDQGTTFGEDRKSCTRTILTSTSSRVDIRVECADHGLKILEAVRIDALDAENVKGSIHVLATGSDHTSNSDSTFTARWLGPVCGTIK